MNALVLGISSDVEPNHTAWIATCKEATAGCVLGKVIIYTTGVAAKNVFGSEEPEFETVPAAMFTLFRCFTDGCNAYDGTPLMERLRPKYGVLFVVAWLSLASQVVAPQTQLFLGWQWDGLFGTRNMLSPWCQDRDFISVLKDADIETANQVARLQRILRSFCHCRRSGWLTMNEIYNGLMRLRGPVAKTEIVGFCYLDARAGQESAGLQVFPGF
eukprot:Skav229259  [mRNA]  locus=scaffold2418:130265:138670:- [translate_table: standard]